MTMTTRSATRTLFGFVSILLGACASSSGGNNSGGVDGGSDAGSDSGGDSASSDPFVGAWDCTGTTIEAFTQPAGMQPQTFNFTSDDTAVDDGNGMATWTAGAKDGGQPACALNCSWSGNTLTVQAGQTCGTGSPGVSCTVTSGVMTLTNSTSCTFQRALSCAGTATVDGGPTQIATTLTESATCTKQ